MPRHVWSVLCQQVITDRETNTPSYITCLEGFSVPELPVPFPPVFLGTLWTSVETDDDVEMRVRIMAPNGDILHTRAHPRKEFAEYKRYRINLRLGGFDVADPGQYEILVEHKEGDTWTEDARIPLTISLIEEE